MTTLTLIVAMDQHRGIGIDNRLPWHLPEDLAYFKRTTSGHPIIMGRKTFLSIGRPLPHRRNIVLTRDTTWQADGVEIAHDLPSALALIDEPDTSKTVFVIGGAQVYDAALPSATRLLVTEVHATFACDAWFPEINPQLWQKTGEEPHVASNQLSYAFITYEKNMELYK